MRNNGSSPGLLRRDPQKRALRIIWKLGAFGGLVLLGQVASFAVFIIVGVLTGEKVPPLLPAMNAVFALLACWFCLRRFDHQGLGSLGIGWDRRWLAHLTVGAVAGFAIFAAVALIYSLAGWASFATTTLTADHVPRLLAGMFLCAAVAAYEELLYRGYAFQLLARWNMGAAVAISGAGFVAIHLPNEGGMAPLAILNLFLAHLLFTACYLRTRSLWLPIAMHAAWNFSEAFVFGMPLSGRIPKTSLFSTDLTHGFWAGHEFGPESGAVVTLLLVVASAVVWRFVKQRNPLPDWLETKPQPAGEATSIAAVAVSADRDRRPLTPESRRLQSIDVLRGVAILGILPMNMQLFAMIDGAFLNPYACEWTDNLNVGVWVFLHVCIGHKDLAIFSMLFGAGIIMAGARDETTDHRAAKLHFRRMGVLFFLGLIHAYLIWPGDILVTYAVCGCLVYAFRRVRPSLLLLLGALAYAVPMALLLAAQFLVPQLTEDQAASIYSIFSPTPAQTAAHYEIYRGSWLQQLPDRAMAAVGVQTLIFVAGMGWVAGGMMLVGMGLHRLEVFSARRSDRFYTLLMLAAAVIGLPLIIVGVLLNFGAHWRAEYSLFGGRLFSECAFPIMALGWIGLLMLICKHGKFRILTGGLAAVGRMALTNYLMHSIICSLIFYGHGLGMVGRIDRVGQLLIAVAIWIAQLAYSPLWLRRFQFGPVEWLLRSIAYGRRQPMKRTMPRQD